MKSSKISTSGTMALQGTTLLIDPRIFLELSTSGASVAIASAATNPIEVLKVRQQLLNSSVLDGVKSPGLVRTGVDLVRNEGALALGRGMSASVARAVIYGSTRLGLYSPLKRALGADGDQLAVLKKSIAGIGSGSIAAGISNPIDMIKTRQMAPGGAGKSPFLVMREVIRNEGVLGLWQGTGPGMARAAILTASQMATYDEVKRAILKSSGWADDSLTHFATSMITGLVCTTATSPADVIKTRLFVDGAKYNGTIDCIRQLARTEGLRGFFKGWTANYIRVGPNTTITFLVLEQLRVLAGLGNV